MALVLDDPMFELTFAINGKAALELARNNEFDLIIVDVRMPVMEGYEFGVQFRKSNPNPHIIFFSSQANSRSFYLSRAGEIPNSSYRDNDVYSFRDFLLQLSQ